jgi:hypothetical protein
MHRSQPRVRRRRSSPAVGQNFLDTSKWYAQAEVWIGRKPFRSAEEKLQVVLGVLKREMTQVEAARRRRQRRRPHPGLVAQNRRVLGVTAEAHVVLRENARRCGGAPVVRQWQMKPVDF